MASIMKRGNTYSVRYNYKDHAGKPCKGWETFKTKAEAQERKITVEKELLDGTFLVPDAMTVEEMLYKWIPIQSTKHKWSPKTYTQHFAINAILQNSAAKAAAMGVAFHAQASIPAEVEIREEDLCALLLNMLDNALEAASQAEPKEVWCKLTLSQGFWPSSVRTPLAAH